MTSPNLQTLQAGQRIAYIQAGWHEDIVGQAFEGFKQELEGHGIAADMIDVVDVPGSLEIPLQAKMMAKTGKYAIIIGTGLVVDGGIYRHDFVASSIIDGFMQVQLETEVPILSVVLTPQNFHEHEDHHKFFTEHFVKKGREAAKACVQTLQNMAVFHTEKQKAA